MNNLKNARLKAKLTQQGMSERFGIPKRTIENWETETRKCPGYVEKLIVEKLEGMAMKEVMEFLENKYGATEMVVEFDGNKYLGCMYGNDECFDGNDFYQYFISVDDKMFKFYYETPEELNEDFDFGTDINYACPFRIKEEDVDYWLENVI